MRTAPPQERSHASAAGSSEAPPLCDAITAGADTSAATARPRTSRSTPNARSPTQPAIPASTGIAAVTSTAHTKLRPIASPHSSSTSCVIG